MEAPNTISLQNNFPPAPPLLRLAFEDSFTGADGEPGVADGPTFVPGHSGLGALFDDSDTVTYGTDGNISWEQGAIEFWLMPLWRGSDGASYVFFEVGDTWFNRMRIMKDGANNFRFMIWSPDREYGVAYNVAVGPLTSGIRSGSPGSQAELSCILMACFARRARRLLCQTACPATLRRIVVLVRSASQSCSG